MQQQQRRRRRPIQPKIRTRIKTRAERFAIGVLLIVAIAWLVWLPALFHRSPAISEKVSSQQVLSTPLSALKNTTIHRFGDASQPSSAAVIVSAFFPLHAKYEPTKYTRWIRLFCSLQDDMVLFTAPEMVETLKSLRSSRTIIVEMQLHQLPIRRLGDASFWMRQLQLDPERLTHKTYEVFWIWLSKSWFVMKATELLAPAQKEFLMWSDMGCFRHTMYKDQLLVRYPHNVPDGTLLWMAHHDPKPPPISLWNDKLGQPEFFFHSGSQAAGTANVWRQFHAAFYETLQAFVAADMFVGEDQCVLQSTCQRYSHLCSYVTYNQVSDNHYFGVRYVLHFEGPYRYWQMLS